MPRKRPEHTSPKVARAASSLLRNRRSSKKVKMVAASALTQAPDRPKKKGKKTSYKRKKR